MRYTRDSINWSGSPEFIRGSVRRRFERKVAPYWETGCWFWIGHLDENGYGKFSNKSKEPRAHRISYELFNGKIPDGLVIDHVCMSKNCVNPSHLEAVTAAVNNKRYVDYYNSIKSTLPQNIWCKNGHIFSSENTYVTPDGRRNCKICRRQTEKRYREKKKGRANGRRQ